MKTGKILNIGGYGYAGRTISVALMDQILGQVISMGRNLHKTENFSKFVEQFIQKVVDYIDITALIGFLSAMEKLDYLAIENDLLEIIHEKP